MRLNDPPRPFDLNGGGLAVRPTLGLDMLWRSRVCFYEDARLVHRTATVPRLGQSIAGPAEHAAEAFVSRVITLRLAGVACGRRGNGSGATAGQRSASLRPSAAALCS